MPSKSKVYFFSDGVRVSLGNLADLAAFVEGIFKREKRPLQTLNYIFCSDSALRKINKDYLSHDYFTDIVTFDLSEGNETVGEIYISVDRVRENAQLHKTAVREEFFRVIFHGALHLCGYGDKSQSEQRSMRAKEDFYLWRMKS